MASSTARSPMSSARRPKASSPCGPVDADERALERSPLEPVVLVADRRRRAVERSGRRRTSPGSRARPGCSGRGCRTASGRCRSASTRPDPGVGISARNVRFEPATRTTASARTGRVIQVRRPARRGSTRRTWPVAVASPKTSSAASPRRPRQPPGTRASAIEQQGRRGRRRRGSFGPRHARHAQDAHAVAAGAEQAVARRATSPC